MCVCASRPYLTRNAIGARIINTVGGSLFYSLSTLAHPLHSPLLSPTVFFFYFVTLRVNPLLLLLLIHFLLLFAETSLAGATILAPAIREDEMGSVISAKLANSFSLCCWIEKRERLSIGGSTNVVHIVIEDCIL